MAGDSHHVTRETTTQTVRPANQGTRLAIGIPGVLLGVAMIVFGAAHKGPVEVRVVLIVGGLAFVGGCAWLLAGAVGIGSGGGKSAQTPSASALPHVVTTEKIKETGLPKEGHMPPKQGGVPPKDP